MDFKPLMQTTTVPGDDNVVYLFRKKPAILYYSIYIYICSPLFPQTLSLLVQALAVVQQLNRKLHGVVLTDINLGLD